MVIVCGNMRGIWGSKGAFITQFTRGEGDQELFLCEQDR